MSAPGLKIIFPMRLSRDCLDNVSLGSLSFDINGCLFFGQEDASESVGFFCCAIALVVLVERECLAHVLLVLPVHDEKERIAAAIISMLSKPFDNRLVLLRTVVPSLFCCVAAVREGRVRVE